MAFISITVVASMIFFQHPSTSSFLSNLFPNDLSTLSESYSYSPTNTELQLRLNKYQGLEKFLVNDLDWEFINIFDNETNISTKYLDIELEINRTVWNFMVDAVANPTLAKCQTAEPYIREDFPNFTCSNSNHRNILLSNLQNFTQKGLRLRKSDIFQNFSKIDNKTIVNILIPKDNLKVNDVLEIGENSITYTVTTFSTTESIDTNVTQENNFSHLTIDNTVAPYDSLVLYYPFDANFTRNDNTTYDYSGSGNDGNPERSPSVDAWNNTGCFVGGCVKIHDKDDNINTNAHIVNTSLNFTYSLWIKREVDGINNGVMWTVTNDASLLRVTNGNVLLYQTNADSTIGTTSITVSSGFTYIAVTYNGTDIVLYVNGIEDGNETKVATDSPTQNHYIGLNDGNNFNGTIDEVMIFNQTLTATQILDIYMNQSNRFHGGGLQEFKDFNVSLGAENAVNVSADFLRDLQSNMSLRMGQWELGLGYQDAIDGDNATVAMEDGIMAWYHFDNVSNQGENDTLAMDWSGNGNNGTASGGFLANNSGYYNGSFHFNFDDGNYVQIDNSLTTVRTIYGWYKIDTFSNFNRLFDWRENNGFSIYCDGSTDCALRYGGTTTDRAVIKNLNTDQWYNFVATHNGTDAIMYLDGALVGSGTVAVDDTAGTFYIGRFNENQQFFNGSIDEVMIWNRSLSSDEIKSLYIKGRALYNFTAPQNLTASLENTTFTIANTSERFLPEFQFIAGNISDIFYSPLLRPNLIFDFFQATVAAAGDDPPVSILSRPGNNSNFTGGSLITFEVNATDDFNLQNITFTLYNPDDSINVSNSTNWTGTTNSTTFVYNLTVDGLYFWNGLVTDNASQTDWAVNFTLNISTFVLGDTCSCPTINTNWVVSMSDNCIISEACDIGIGNLSFTDTGNYTCDANINISHMLNVPSNSIVYIFDQCLLEVTKT